MINTAPTTREEAPIMSLMPLVRRTLRESAYLLSGFPLAVASFVVSVTLFSAGVGTVVVWIGVPILVLALTVAGGFADTERRLVTAATGRPMPTPTYRAAAPTASLPRRLLAPLADSQRWIELIWTLVHFVIATFTFCVTVSWWAASAWLLLGPVANPILDAAIPDRGPSIGGLRGLPPGLGSDLVEYIIAAICLLTLPFVIRGLTALQTGVSHAFLSLRSGYEAQISDLRESRSSAHRAEAQSLHRLERDIHDGPQQRLIRLQLDLARAERAAASDPERARTLLAEARAQANDTLAELRNLSRGIAPPILVDRGLDAAVEELAARSEVLTTVDSETGDLPHHVATTAYFVVAEALTNVNKHSVANHAHVTLEKAADHLVVSVTDNGVGGASLAKGHGLAGLAERVRSVDGTLEVDSPSAARRP